MRILLMSLLLAGCASLMEPKPLPPGSPPGAYWSQSCVGMVCQDYVLVPVGESSQGSFTEPMRH
jgi:hypothetical protein